MQVVKYLILLGILALEGSSAQLAFAQSTLKSVAVAVTGAKDGDGLSVDAVVEAVRQTSMSSQVLASVTALQVKAGDKVRKGQVLIALDNNSAQEGIASSSAQLEAAKANLNLAGKDLDRKAQLLTKEYISQSAFDRSQAQYDTAVSQVNALAAQHAVAKNNAHFYTLKAPYDALVSEINVSIGDLATPGRALLTLYDPNALRLKAFVAQSVQSKLGSKARIEYEIPDSSSSNERQKTNLYQWIPNVDASTHTIEMRIPLPNTPTSLMPGSFARIVLLGFESAQERLWVPKNTVIFRSELVAVYVIDQNNQAKLRQIKLGETKGSLVEVLSGLSKGEWVSLEPQVAAKAH